MANNNKSYTTIAGQVRDDEDLSSSEKIFFGEIYSLSKKYGYCMASNKYLAEQSGVAENTINHWLKDLENKGYIRREIVKNELGEYRGRRIYPLVVQWQYGWADRILDDLLVAKNDDHKFEVDIVKIAKRHHKKVKQIIYYMELLEEQGKASWDFVEVKIKGKIDDERI